MTQGDVFQAIESIQMDRDISGLNFSPAVPSLLLSSAWDASLTLHDISRNLCVNSWTFEAPLLDCHFSLDGNLAYTAGLGRVVKEVDLQTGQMRPIGKHNDAISCLSVVSRHEVVSGSWDSTARMWDVRSASSQETLSLPDKVFAMDVHRESHTLVVATAQRHMYVYDLRSLSNGPFQKRLSPLKLSTRSLRIMPYGQGFAVGSIEGRIALEYFDQGENDKSKYAFKCHREVDSDGQDCVYPVHALAFHEKYETFASGGGDGRVNVWDGQHKKRIRQFPQRMPVGREVSSLAFNSDGSCLAIGSIGSLLNAYSSDSINQSNCSTSGSIWIRKLGRSDVEPKRVS